MKAQQFIKEHGVKKAREVVEGAPEGTWKYISGWHHRYGDEVNEWGAYEPEYEMYHPMAGKSNAGRFDSNKRQLECIDLSDLKRLVESVDIIVKFGSDIDGAKQLLEFVKDCQSVSIGQRTIQVERLTKSIADYESIYGEGNEN